MASTIITKHGTGSATPSSLTHGELAINVTNGSLYYGSSGSSGANSVSSSFTFGAVTASVVSSSGNVEGLTLVAKGLTAGSIVFVGEDGVLSNDTDLTFSTDTLTSAKIGAFEAAGAINFSSQDMTNVDIDSGTIDNCVIGGATAVAGTFTNITATGNTSLGDAASDTHSFRGHVTHSAAFTSSAGITASNLTISGDITGSNLQCDRYTYNYHRVQGKSTVTTNWGITGANGLDGGTWNTDLGVATTAISSSLATMNRQQAAAGIVMPYDCEIIGFNGVGRNNSNASHGWSASLWHGQPNYGVSTTNNTTMRCVAFQSSSIPDITDPSGEEGNNWTGAATTQDLTRNIRVKAGTIIMPALKSNADNGHTILCSFTIVTRSKISSIDSLLL